MDHTIKVLLHSNSEAAANATDTTLRMLPMAAAYLKRGDDGKVEFDADGYATVLTANPGFVVFALKNQGYVKEVSD